ncbi:PREDICTED: BET1-like protein isoform X1 [Colobus angolensis palliatus]|uniref:BET1-like protein isoform X1 n=1 Tax=Colobus angolensis palliatus TaxID=336983 RepID=UPI0005F3920B|nr:PREDICTED: BET1-like protein isoform X1 [Colobus angolensis palliatus]
MADWARAQSPGAVEEILDRENKRMADSLASKVTRLKSLALDIDRDAEDQNRYLDGMGKDVSQWELVSVGAKGSQGLPCLASWSPEDLPTKYSFEIIIVGQESSFCVAGGCGCL